MKMMNKSALAALVLVVATGVAQARGVVPIVEPSRVAITQADKPLPADAIQRAIVAGGAVQGWMAVSQEPGQMTLRYAKSNYEAVVRVDFDGTGFQIHYVSSMGLKATGSGADASIHPNYNRWIESLNRTITLEASRIQR